MAIAQCGTASHSIVQRGPRLAPGGTQAGKRICKDGRPEGTGEHCDGGRSDRRNESLSGFRGLCFDRCALILGGWENRAASTRPSPACLSARSTTNGKRKGNRMPRRDPCDKTLTVTRVDHAAACSLALLRSKGRDGRRHAPVRSPGSRHRPLSRRPETGPHRTHTYDLLSLVRPMRVCWS